MKARILLVLLAAACTQVEYVEAPFHECGTDPDAADIDASEPDASEPDAEIVFDASPPDAMAVADAAPPAPDAAPPSCSSSAMGNGFHMMTSAGTLRRYYVDLPSSCPAGGCPLMFMWHGTSQTADSFYSTADFGSWRAAGWIIIGPDSAGFGPSLWPVWAGLPGLPGYTLPTPDPDLAIFDDMIACAKLRLNVDTNRIFTAGHSAGGVQANYVLKQRSNVLAGGIIASGVEQYTDTSPPAAVNSNMVVIVTWGGSNDMYYVGGAFGTVVFGPHAVAASTYWEAHTHQVHCKGTNRGHAWLTPVNPFMRNFLNAHPKNMSTIPGETLPSDGSSVVACSEAVATSP